MNEVPVPESYMKVKSSYRKVRKAFPKVYETPQGYLVSARSRKWNLDERSHFKTEQEALDRARAIEKQIQQTGAQPEMPKEKLLMAVAYERLIERLTPYGKTPEEAVNHYLAHLGSELLRQAKPFISELADKWQVFKFTDTSLSKRFTTEIKSYTKFIKATWGRSKPDEVKKNEIDICLRKLKVTNNTRRKYLRMVRMFFSWCKDETHILYNPTDGVAYKPDDFDGDFYDVPTTKKLLRYVVEKEKDLIGYYSLLAFAGLRPTEGARVQWKDYNSTTNELYVRKGKTNARHIILEPVAAAWIKYHKENTLAGKPFVEKKALPNREKNIREQTLNGDWIQDGLRHGFGTYYKSKIKSVNLVADYMGNSSDIVKRHYARTVPADECLAFWSLTPEEVLRGEFKHEELPKNKHRKKPVAKVPVAVEPEPEPIRINV
jgi:integrase